jgi:hypothetical protein
MYSEKKDRSKYPPPLSSPCEPYMLLMNIILIFCLLFQRKNYKCSQNVIWWFSPGISFWHVINSSGLMVTGIRSSGSPLISSATEICYCVFEILVLKLCSMLNVCALSWYEKFGFIVILSVTLNFVLSSVASRQSSLLTFIIDCSFFITLMLSFNNSYQQHKEEAYVCRCS